MTTHRLTHRWLVFLGILLTAVAFRLYKITSEPLDWHAFRQADTASVTREYVKHGINWLVPHYQDLANIQSGHDNLEGNRMVEFPLVNALVAWIVMNTGWSLVITSRVVSMLFSLGTLVCLYLLVEKLSGKTVARLTALIFAVLPYAVFYSRAILPEPPMLFFSTLSLWTFLNWLQTKTKSRWLWYGASFAALLVGLLLKPNVAFLVPIYAGLIAFHEWPIKDRSRSGLVRKASYYLVTVGAGMVVAVAPLIWWRKWIEQYPSGIPALDWLFNGNGIRFRPAWFRWLGWERLTKLISGYFGVLVLPFNFLDHHKDLWVYSTWWLGIAVYLSVIATGNVQHDYYQVLAVPIICISLARGSVALYHWLRAKVGIRPAFGLVTGLLVLGWWFAWQAVKGYYSINHPEYIVAGQAVDRLTPPDALVIAPAFGDTQFLFQTNRRGWPIGFEIEDKIAKGAQFYITTSDDDEARRLSKEYTVIEKTDTYLLIDLRQKQSQPK